MAETATQTPSHVVVTEEKPSFLQRFAQSHPKTSRVIAIILAVFGVAGALTVAKTVRSNKAHLESAGDPATEALDELSSSVSPTDPEA
jgi:hypothetical protein